MFETEFYPAKTDLTERILDQTAVNMNQFLT